MVVLGSAVSETQSSPMNYLYRLRTKTVDRILVLSPASVELFPHGLVKALWWSYLRATRHPSI